MSLLSSRGRLFKLNEHVLLIIAAFYVASFQNTAFWNKALRLLNVYNITDILFIISIFIFIFTTTLIVFNLLCWKWTLKPVIILFLVIGALCDYFSAAYQVYIDRMMLVNVFKTDVHEAFDLLTLRLFFRVLFLAVLPGIFVIKTSVIRPQKVSHYLLIKCGVIVAAFLLLLGTSLPMYKDYASFFRNNVGIVKLVTPSNYIIASVSYLKQFYYSSFKKHQQIGLDARQVKDSTIEGNKKKTVLVIVVGETARAQNFSLNGYDKETNPLLSRQNNLVSFQNATSCGTVTAYSVPCMFSAQNREKFSYNDADYTDNLLDMLNRAGIHVSWIENNAGCQGVCARTGSRTITNQSCHEGLCSDENLITALADELKAISKDSVIVLHTNGSHGPAYYQRYPKAFEKFRPSCNTNQIQSCSQTELLNTYDNTIVFTDYVINRLIEELKRYDTTLNAGLIYLSDHGESLGEKGVYLHGTPYMIAPREQTHIPMIFWASDQLSQARRIDLSCLQKKALNEEVSHDNLFHTVLDLMRVQTDLYRSNLDLIDNCEKK